MQGVRNHSTDFLYVTVDLVILGFKAWSVSILWVFPPFAILCKMPQKENNRKEFGNFFLVFLICWSESACTFIEGNTLAMLVWWVVCTFIESNTLAMLVHGVMWMGKKPHCGDLLNIRGLGQRSPSPASHFGNVLSSLHLLLESQTDLIPISRHTFPSHSSGTDITLQEGIHGHSEPAPTSAPWRMNPTLIPSQFIPISRIVKAALTSVNHLLTW